MTARVIWEREIDHERIAARWASFRKRFFPLAIVVFVAALIFTGLANALGVLLVLAIIGGAWAATVHVQGLSDAANPTMTVEDGRLKLGDRVVILEDVKRFTTLAVSQQTSVLGDYSRIDVGKALFRMDMPGTRAEPLLVELGWPNMDDEGVAGVRQALEGELPGKWVPFDKLAPEVAKDDDRRGRRSRRRR